MGFGDFAMGYLVGQSFSGPNHIPDGSAPYSEWSSQAKKDWDKKCDEAYWRAWDKACKEKVIERLRKHDTTFAILTFHQQPIYPNMTQDEQADLLERGELRLVAPTKNLGPLGAIWADETREEAQDSVYLRLKTEVIDRLLAEEGYRIVL